MRRFKIVKFVCVVLTLCRIVSAAPAIQLLQNNYGGIPQSLPNYGIAPSTIFFVQGAELANTTSDLQSSAAPRLQTTLDGVSVAVTVGHTTVQCPLYYISPAQIDAVLPGQVPVGSGTITVTNNGTASPPYPINVVQTAFGILTLSGSSAAAFDAGWNLISAANPAHPNQTIVLWGSGVGYDPNDDDRLFPQQQDNLMNIQMSVLVGGLQAAVLYRGRSQYPGLDQLVITVPPAVRTGCYVSIAIVSTTALIPSITAPVSSATLPLAADGAACSDATTELTPDIELGLAQKGAVNLGFLNVSQVTTTIATPTGVSGLVSLLNTPIATFQSTLPYTGVFPTLSLGGCVVNYTPLTPLRPSTAPLDAGSAITVTGPGGSVSLPLDSNSPPGETRYYLPRGAPPSFIPTTGGTFAFDNGTGGNNVSPFTANINMPPTFTWIDPPNPAVINRAVGRLVTWSGGGDTDTFVLIMGTSYLGTAAFYCAAPVGALQFAIPSFIFQALPPGNGTLTVANYSKFKLFRAPGLDLGLSGAASVSQRINIMLN